MTLAGLRNRVLISLLFGLAVALAVALYGDLSSIVDAFRHFRWSYLPAIVGLTLLNYLLRYVKWQFYLGQLGIDGISRRESFLVFFSGLSMVMTPGKVGEWLKSYLLRELQGTPMSRSAPIIVAERLTDGVAMLLLASGGLLLFGLGVEVLAFVGGLALAIVVVSQYRPLAHRLIQLAERLPVVAPRAHVLHDFYDSAHALLRPRSLGLAVGLGFISWSGECLAYYLVLRGLSGEAWSIAPGALPVLQATFILAVSTLAGSVFLLPGGLGVAEGGLTALSQLLLGLPRDLAAVGTLLIRFSTLWFGVLLGLLSLAVMLRRLQRYSPLSSISSSSSNSSSLYTPTSRP